MLRFDESTAAEVVDAVPVAFDPDGCPTPGTLDEPLLAGVSWPVVFVLCVEVVAVFVVNVPVLDSCALSQHHVAEVVVVVPESCKKKKTHEKN